MQRRRGLRGQRALARGRHTPSGRRVWLLVPCALALALLTAPSAEAVGRGATRGIPRLGLARDAFDTPSPPPTVTINPPPLVSNATTPSFSGTASDTTPVTVDLYRGPVAEGTPMATLEASVNNGSWASASVSPPLTNGRYTAAAVQESSAGNATGLSRAVSFEVNSQAPTVSLTAPAPRSNDTAPSFSGTASASTQVTVEVFEGSRPEGVLVALATASGTPGSWSSGPLQLTLSDGSFTAVALQRSPSGDATGESAPATFVVDTEPPRVTLTPPPSPTNDTTPSFSGSSDEATPVTVEIFKGSPAEGKPVAGASAAVTGEQWTSASAAPPLSDGTYTAIATQPSAIGNPAGHSAAVAFVVDTAPPVVSLTAPRSPSGNRSPSFSGTATDHTPVTLEVFAGASAQAPAVASAQAEVDHGKWVSAKVSPQLSWGEYTVLARQPSSIGNPQGTSARSRSWSRRSRPRSPPKLRRR
jgi:hypothetical protein